MEMKYYNASNHFSAPIRREPKPYVPPKPITERIVPIKVEEEPKQHRGIKSSEKVKLPLFSKDLNQDDMLILGLIFLLLLNSCDDYLLLAVLAFIFLSDCKEQ